MSKSQLPAVIPPDRAKLLVQQEAADEKAQKANRRYLAIYEKTRELKDDGSIVIVGLIAVFGGLASIGGIICLATAAPVTASVGTIAGAGLLFMPLVRQTIILPRKLRKAEEAKIEAQNAKAKLDRSLQAQKQAELAAETARFAAPVREAMLNAAGRAPLETGNTFHRDRRADARPRPQGRDF